MLFSRRDCLTTNWRRSRSWFATHKRGVLSSQTGLHTASWFGASSMMYCTTTTTVPYIWQFCCWSVITKTALSIKLVLGITWVAHMALMYSTTHLSPAAEILFAISRRFGAKIVMHRRLWFCYPRDKVLRVTLEIALIGAGLTFSYTAIKGMFLCITPKHRLLNV